MKASRLLLIAGCVIAAGIFIACGDDFVSPPPPEQIVFKDLTSGDDVLFNLELAYNERNLAEYDKLLDESFVFVFSEADYNSGTVTVRQWERADEIASNTRILSLSNPDPNRIISIVLELDYTRGVWTPEPPGGEHPDETWYVKNAVYRLVIKTAERWEYRAIDVATQFRIRKDDGGHWRIVEWRDHDSTTPIPGALSPTVEETTWGSIKSLYYPDPYKNLTAQDDVLHNLELAYNNRNFTEFEKLLDDSFEFYFSEADFNSGIAPFENWGRIDEVNANQRMLDTNNPDPNRIISVDLDLDYTPGVWTPEPPGGSHPLETWYVKNVVYRLVMKTADAWEYRALDVKSNFIIRADDGGHWRIVEWYDDRDSTTPIPGALSPSVQETTWGGIKSLYYSRPKNDG